MIPVSIHSNEPKKAIDIVETKPAARVAFRSPESIKGRPLNTIQAIHQKDQEKANDSIKTESLGLGFFSRISVWSVVTVLKSVRFCMMLGSHSNKERESTDERLNELTGSIHTAKTLHALSATIACSIQNKLSSLNTYESLTAFFKEERHSLETLVDILLPVIYKNLAKNAQECHQTEKQRTIVLADVVSFICETIHNHLPYIQQRIANIDEIQDIDKKNKIICQTFSRIVDEFMGIALPNGINELPLTKIPFLSHNYWDLLQKQVLPVLFYDLYQELTFPARENKKEVLLKMAGGESLASLSQSAAERAAELLPEIFLDPTEGNYDPTDQSQIPLVVKMAKGFASLLDGSELFKTWTSNWFSKELMLLGKSDDVYLKKFWKLIGGYAEPLLNHVFVSMTDVCAAQDSARGRIPDAIGIILIRLLSLSSRFHNQNHKQILERIEHLKHTGENYKEDEILLNFFKPFADDLFCLMGLNNPAKLPLPWFLQGLITGPLKTHAPAFLLRQYVALMNIETDDHSTHQKLRTLLFDSRNLDDPELAIKIMNVLHKSTGGTEPEMFNVFYRHLWLESGTEKIAKTLEAMCAVLGSEVVNSTSKYYGIADQTLLKEESNPLMVSVKQKLTSLAEMIFLKILVHIMETGEEKPSSDQHPKYLAAFNIMGQIIRLVNKRLEEFKSGVDKKAIFGLATDLYAFAGINPFQSLPLQELPGSTSIKNGMNASLRNALLPCFVEQLYLDTMQWQFKLQDSLQELDKTYHTTHSKWVCKVIAQYATDYMRHYLRNPTGDAGKVVFSSLKSYFGSFKDVAAPLDDLQPEIESLFKENLQKLAESDDDELNALWPALTRYFEAAAAKFLAGFSKTIREIEAENPDLTVDIAIQILKDTARHFSIVTKATQEAGAEQTFEVPLGDMIDAFGKELHDGVPLDPFDTAENKEKVRLQGFFIPLAEKLFKVADLSIKDLSVPRIFKHQLGELTFKKMLPLALLRSFQKLLEPQVRNVLMLNIMQTLYAAFNGNELAKRNGGIKEAISYPDPKQKRLYETCGYVVLELVKLIPDTIVQYVFMKEKVKDMSAQAIGDALMPYLSRWTLLQMLDKVIYLGLPNFHPSKWEGKQGREDLVPLKPFVRPDGNMELKKVKEFKFHFPLTEGEINAAREAKIRETFEVRMELRNAYTTTISQQLHVKAWAFAKSLWKGLQDHLNDLVERMFSQNGLAAKGMIDKVLRRICIDVFGTVIQFLFAPLLAFIQFVSEKTVINRRSDDIIESFQSELMENLVYKWTDTVFDSLLRLKKT